MAVATETLRSEFSQDELRFSVGSVVRVTHTLRMPTLTQDELPKKRVGWLRRKAPDQERQCWRVSEQILEGTLSSYIPAATQDIPEQHRDRNGTAKSAAFLCTITDVRLVLQDGIVKNEAPGDLVILAKDCPGHTYKIEPLSQIPEQKTVQL